MLCHCIWKKRQRHMPARAAYTSHTKRDNPPIHAIPYRCASGLYHYRPLCNCPLAFQSCTIRLILDQTPSDIHNIVGKMNILNWDSAIHINKNM